MALFLENLSWNLVFNILILAALIWLPVAFYTGSTPFFRGRDGFCYFIWSGRNIRDPSTEGGEGEAAGKKTRGNFERVLLVFDGYRINSNGDIIAIRAGDKNNRGILGLGVHYVGFWHVVEVMRNKWAEIVNDRYQERSVTEYGFSVKRNPMAFKLLAVEDIGNIPFDLLGKFYWSIVNPIKARRITQDAYVMVLEILLGELVAWFKKKEIYQPPQINIAELKKIGETCDVDNIKTTEIAGVQTMTADQVKEGFWNYLQETRDFKDQKGNIQQMTLLQYIEERYGYSVDDMAISSIDPGAGFKEALAGIAKQRLESAAQFLKAVVDKMSEFQAKDAAEAWGESIKKNKDVFLGQVARSFVQFGVPPLSGLQEYLKEVIPDGKLSNDDLKKLAEEVMKVRKNKE